MNPVTMCRLLTAQFRVVQSEPYTPYWKFWYDHVYTPITQELIKEYPEINTVRWSWCVATGEEWA